MERRGRLTYERLINRLERLHGAVETQFSKHKDIERVQDLQRTITDALAAARAGRSGAVVESPVQLKRDVEARIVEVHERYSEIDGQDNYASEASNKHTSLSTTKKISAPGRISCSPEGSKENTSPPPVLFQHPPIKKLSAVRKTAIIKRTNSKPSTAVGVKKHSARPNCNKPALHPATDEADRHAAAAALLGLAEHSPEKLFTSTTVATSSSSVLTPSTGGKKRTRFAYEGKMDSSEHVASQEYVSSSLTPKRRILEQSKYAPISELNEGLGVKEAFLRGVEYAVQQLGIRQGSEGQEAEEGLIAWVCGELGPRDGLEMDGDLGVGDLDEKNGAAATARGEGKSMVVISSEVEGKGFWDVV